MATVSGDEPSGSHTPRQLTDDEKSLLAADKVTISDFKQQLLEKDAQKNWDIFYKRNTTAFYKDRHWTSREFPELTQVSGPILPFMKHTFASCDNKG